MTIRPLSIALLAGVAALTSVSATQAADLPYQTTVPAVTYADAGIALATDAWTGLYAGAHIGGATSDEFKEGKTAWTGGVQAGYLQQFDMFVVGAEVEAAFTDALLYELAPGAGLTQNWSVAAKARAGIALGDTLIYGTAGASLAELEPWGTTTSGKDNHVGVVFGAGVEQNLGNNFSLRAEYLQTRYFDVDSAVGGIGRQDDLTNHAVKVGVNYRF